jgi:hypothetical protein
VKLCLNLKARYFIHVVLPVVVGAAIYTCWRSRQLLVFSWYRAAGLLGIVVKLRLLVAPLRHFVPNPILYSLPDALWVYSFTALMCLLWGLERNSAARTFWLSLPTILAVGAEFGQLSKWIPGTFDPVDIASYLLAGFLGYALSQLLGPSIQIVRLSEPHVAE